MVTHGRLHPSDACELVSLNAVEPGRGIGTALLGVVEDTARDRGAARVWLITTNDNPQALGFYQWHGYRLVAVHAGAVDAARALKPSIPKRGVNGVPLHDELELEKRL
ncbi:MAG TPA: GNAT family N-acetyltransferase [Thermomicrobiaceae bacterium]|nr:GNAT family N-acetyltransferase [Thermomicrobiaceae bacterium]